MCLTLGVTLLSSTIDMKPVLYSQCTVGSPVWSSNAPIQHQITLVFLAALYMHLIYPSVEYEATSICICTLNQTENTRRV